MVRETINILELNNYETVAHNSIQIQIRHIKAHKPQEHKRQIARVQSHKSTCGTKLAIECIIIIIAIASFKLTCN